MCDRRSLSREAFPLMSVGMRKCTYLTLQSLLQPYVARFYIRAGDMSQVKQAKIRILVSLLSPGNGQSLLREFKVRTTHFDYLSSTLILRTLGCRTTWLTRTTRWSPMLSGRSVAAHK